MIVNEELDRVLKGYFDEYPKGSDKEEMMVVMRKWVNRLADSWETEHVEEAVTLYEKADSKCESHI